MTGPRFRLSQSNASIYAEEYAEYEVKHAIKYEDNMQHIHNAQIILKPTLKEYAHLRYYYANEETIYANYAHNLVLKNTRKIRLNMSNKKLIQIRKTRKAFADFLCTNMHNTH